MRSYWWLQVLLVLASKGFDTGDWSTAGFVITGYACWFLLSPCFLRLISVLVSLLSIVYKWFWLNSKIMSMVFFCVILHLETLVLEAVWMENYACRWQNSSEIKYFVHSDVKFNLCRAGKFLAFTPKC